MRITNEADYALRIVYSLLGGSQKSAKLIAEQTGVTLRFALKILRKLAMAEIVGARQGASGGYYLKKKPAEISIGLVVETIDGPFEVNNCLDGEFVCSRMGKDVDACSFHCYFSDLNSIIREHMYRATLDQFMKN
ncbi:MAG: Rrf2 family transcriptional regulator [Clostridia bacterium]|nr:Rrf2 family transcriptional regulator [Clostridia bacterium]